MSGNAQAHPAPSGLWPRHQWLKRNQQCVISNSNPPRFRSPSCKSHDFRSVSLQINYNGHTQSIRPRAHTDCAGGQRRRGRGDRPADVVARVGGGDDDGDGQQLRRPTTQLRPPLLLLLVLRGRRERNRSGNRFEGLRTTRVDGFFFFSIPYFWKLTYQQFGNIIPLICFIGRTAERSGVAVGRATVRAPIGVSSSSHYIRTYTYIRTCI